MNPFASVARFARSPLFRRGAPLAGAAALGATGDEAIEGMVADHDGRVRDDAAREILGSLMRAEDQHSMMQQQQQQAYMAGADDVAQALAQSMQGAGGGGAGGYGSYDDLASSDGMYSLAMAAMPKTALSRALSMAPPKLPSPPTSSAGLGGPHSSIKPPALKTGPGIRGVNHTASAVIGEIPFVLAEALGMDKEALSPAVLGALAGAGTAGFAHGGDTRSRIQDALIGAVLGGAGGKVLSNPTTLARLKGMVT